MTTLDLDDLAAAWKLHPPTHLAIASLEGTLLAVNGIDPSILGRGVAAKPQPTFVDEASVRALVAELNGGA